MSDTKNAKDDVEMEDVNSVGAVDEKLYSRQLYVMGHEAQRRMMSSSVLLIGLSGLGVEIAKNVILAGISSLTVLDENNVNYWDLNSNFYLSDENVGKPRAEVAIKALKELNPYVNVLKASGQESYAELCKSKACVVVTIPLPTSTLFEINEICRAQGTGFIYTFTCSVFGMVFCDFGPTFVVNDKDGENPAQCQVESIIPSNPAVVKVLEDQGRHGLESGDVVMFDRVVGLDGHLENKKEYEVKVTGLYTFELVGCDFSNAKSSATQGYITQVKKPVTISFRSMEKCFEEVQDSDFILVDFAKMERPRQLHYAFRALGLYKEQKGKFPDPGDLEAASDLYLLAQKLEPSIFNDDKARKLMYHISSGANTSLSPMCAIYGGVVGQEVLKACSGKFMPIKQFMYLDAEECLPKEMLPSEEISPRQSRYDSQIAVFGKSMQDKICDLSYFLVGAGAIGCEMLKNWAMMGLGCGKGHVYITDMDSIEKSNLSRQFLFRSSDINSFKSSTAARAAQTMNSALNITSYQEKVGADSEHIFADSFYDSLNGICTALDNVEARLYVDQKCLFYRLPMLESGTLGTKGNTQIVVPHLTENYGATRDPPEKSIPVCTLKNFPNQIHHTLQWAKDYFEGVFKLSAEDANTFLNTPNYEKTVLASETNANQKQETVKNIHKILVEEKPKDFTDCIVWSRLLFEQLFSSQIRQLLYNFPEDQVTSTGNKFWSGSKRCPKYLTFDTKHVCDEAQMQNHLNFITAASNLRAEMFGIEGSFDEKLIIDVLDKTIVPDFVPKDGVKIAENDRENEDMMNSTEVDVDSECNVLLQEIPTTKISLHPIEFDKDVDLHMLFVTSCSNLRALNYSIPTEDTHRSRAIAGRIIPAIATTTALVTGLICLELYKIVGTSRVPVKLEDFKNAFCNLAIPFMTLSEPSPPKKTKALLKGKEWNWTSWDSLDMDCGDVTLKEFIEFFSKEYNLDMSMISQGVSILYSFFANKKKIQERMKMKMSDIVQTVGKKQLPPNQNYIVFEVIANDLDTDEEVEVPYIRYKFM